MFNFSKILFLSIKSIFLIVILNYLISCSNTPNQNKAINSIFIVDSLVDSAGINGEIKEKTEIELYLENLNLIDLTSIDKGLIIDLKYSTEHNFLHTDLYGDFNKAYLVKDVAEMLVKANKYLNDTFPNYNLIVFDATRPLDIQKKMWEIINVPEKDKGKYLSNPKYGSLHNFGAAVDVSIANEKGEELDMGTEYDSFEELAYPIMEKALLKQGQLSVSQVNNRKLLRRVMEKAGFFNIQTEWWHFNACYRKEARKKYALIQSFNIPNENVLIAETEQIKDVASKNNIVTFKVQLLATKQKLSEMDKRFLGLEVHRYFHKGLYKYTSGVFNNIDSAFMYKNKILENGINEAFIVAFNNGERINIKEAIELLH